MSEAEEVSELLEPAREEFIERTHSDTKDNVRNDYKELFKDLKAVQKVIFAADDLENRKNSKNYAVVLNKLTDMGLMERYGSKKDGSKFYAGEVDDNLDWELYDADHWDSREKVLEKVMAADDYLDFEK